MPGPFSKDYYYKSGGGVNIDGATILSDYPPNTGTVTGVLTFTNLGLEVQPNNDSVGVYKIADSSVLYEYGDFMGDGNIGETFTGHITYLTINNQSGSGSSCTGTLTVALADEIAFYLNAEGDSFQVTTSQTEPLIIDFAGYGSSQSAQVNAASVTEFQLNAGTLVLNSGNSLTFNGAFNQASVDGVLQTLIDTACSGISLTFGGTSSPPTPRAPEIDTIQVVNPANGDTGAFANSRSSSVIYFVFSSAISLASSSLGAGSTVTMGISDTPSNAQIATKMASFLTTHFSYATVSIISDTITINDATSASWPYDQPIALASLVFTNTQTGVPNLADTLAGNGNTVTTN